MSFGSPINGSRGARIRTTPPSTVGGVQLLQIDPKDLEALPPELRERFPEVVDELRRGVIDEVPDSVIDALPASVVDRIPPDLLAGVNTTLVMVLAAIAGIALMGFFYGVTKAAAKAAMFFLVVGGIAGFLLYSQY